MNCFTQHTEEQEFVKDILSINKTLALQIIKFKRIGELIIREKKWYDNPQQIPKVWIDDFNIYEKKSKKDLKDMELRIY